MSVPIFKYMSRKNATKLLEFGEIRVGTLYSYRDQERFGSQVGDPGEGTLHLRKSGEVRLDTAQPDTVPEFVRGSIKVGSGSRLQIMSSDGIGRDFEDKDCWIYCASLVFDPSAMNAMDYDTCVEISDIRSFFTAVTLEIRKQFWGAAGCVYSERAMEHTAYTGAPPAFIKPLNFQHQAEVRALWLPLPGDTIAPVTVFSKEAAVHCKIISCEATPNNRMQRSGSP
jgi:hypothetical protein